MVQEEGRTPTLLETLQNINEKLDGLDQKKEKKKRFKLPGSARRGAKNKLKKGWVLVVIIGRNAVVDIKFLPTTNDIVYLPNRGTFHLASSEFMFRYEKYPMLILPESLHEPLLPHKVCEMSIDKPTPISGQQAVLNNIKAGELKGKRPMPGKTWIILGILAVVVVYIISKMLGVQ
jgi:hypothetical protein